MKFTYVSSSNAFTSNLVVNFSFFQQPILVQKPLLNDFSVW